jgi:hypothetical protein
LGDFPGQQDRNEVGRKTPQVAIIIQMIIEKALNVGFYPSIVHMSIACLKFGMRN